MCGNAQNTPSADILALTKMLYKIGMRKILSGQEVSQENIATLNRTRAAINKHESKINGEENG